MTFGCSYIGWRFILTSNKLFLKISSVTCRQYTFESYNSTSRENVSLMSYNYCMCILFHSINVYLLYIIYTKHRAVYDLNFKEVRNERNRHFILYVTWNHVWQIDEWFIWVRKTHVSIRCEKVGGHVILFRYTDSRYYIRWRFGPVILIG